MIKIREIERIIENKLEKRIRKDLKNYQITNERDFESIVYFHLKKGLKKFKKIKISTNYTIEGLNVWKENDKTHKWELANFVMPDIVISEIPSDIRKPLNHLIAFELKTRSPGEDTVPNFNSEEYELDFRKLNRLVKSGKVEQAYYFLIYSDPIENEKDVKEEISECRFSWGKASSKNKARKTKPKLFSSIVFNRYVLDQKTKKIEQDEKKRAEIQYRSMRYFRTYSKGNEPLARKKKLKSLKKFIGI